MCKVLSSAKAELVTLFHNGKEACTCSVHASQNSAILNCLPQSKPTTAPLLALPMTASRKSDPKQSICDFIGFATVSGKDNSMSLLEKGNPQQGGLLHQTPSCLSSSSHSFFVFALATLPFQKIFRMPPKFR
jgi:hypothetical protein